MIPNPLNLPDEGDFLQAVGFEILLERRRVADIVLPTGRLVACDPLTMPETEPFATATPVGTFPVYAIVAKLREEVRTAYAVIEFSDVRPHRWEIAHVMGEEPSRWSGDRSGFHVDSNIAGFMDNATGEFLLHLMQYAEDDEELEKLVHADMRRTRRSGGQVSYADIDLDPRTKGNLVAFEVDAGTYSSYLGYDGDDEVAMVVLDFEVLEYRFTPFGLKY